MALNRHLAAELNAVPPHSIEAEMAALGAAIVSSSAAQRLPELLQRDDFYLEGHRCLYDAVAGLVRRNDKVDIVTVPEELKAHGQLERVGGLAYVIQVQDSVPTARHVDYYAGIVAEKAQRRRLLDASFRIAAIAEEADNEEAALVQAEALLARLRKRSVRVLDGGITAPELLALDLPEVAWIVPGLFTEGLTILAGKSKFGKSWMSYQIAVAVALGGTALGAVPVQSGRVLYLALEDPRRRLQNRLRRILGETQAPPLLHLYNRWPRMHEGGQRDLLAWFRQYPDTRLVIIDTFAKIRSYPDRPGNAYDEDSRAFGDVKQLADDHGASILVVHHFNKAKPTDDWVDSVSGSIGVSGAADGIVGFFRERSRREVVLKITGRDIEDETDKALTWSDEGGPWTLQGDAQAYYQSEAEQAVLKLLWNEGALHSLAPREVSDLLAENHQTIKSRLWRMAERGLLQTDNGAYSLSSQQITAFRATAETAVSLQPCNRATGHAQAVAVAAVEPVSAVAPVARLQPFLEAEAPDHGEPPPEETGWGGEDDAS